MNYLVRILVILALFLSALFIAPALIDEKGYILIAFGNYTIELSVVSFGFILLATIVAVFVALRVLNIGWASASRMGLWLRKFSFGSSEKHFYDGLYKLLMGDQNGAEKSFFRIDQGDYHGFHYVALGQLALQRNDETKALEWFNHTKIVDDRQAGLAAAVLLAQYYLQQNRPEEALSCLEKYEDNKNPYLVNVKSQALTQSQQWDALQNKLPKWKKSLGANYADTMQNVASLQFSEIASKEGANQLKEHWDTLTWKQRRDPAYRKAMLVQLMSQGMHEDAQDFLVKWYKTDTLPSVFLDVVKHLRLPNPAPTIKLLEGALKTSPEDPILYATLGHIAYYSKDFALSERALAKAITLHETKDELMLLADIYEQNNAHDEAMQALRRAVALTT